MRKIVLFFLLFSFFYSNANDSLKTQPKNFHFFSFLPSRLLVGETVLFYEFVNNKKKGIEIGLGYILPLNDYPILYSYYFNTGNFHLYGTSIYLSKKIYNIAKNHPFFYLAPEIIIRYEFGTKIPVQPKMYSPPWSYGEQERISTTLSVKMGWRVKSGLLDFYYGIGLKTRYAQTQYIDLNPACHCPGSLTDDNGLYFYLVPRIGLKVGFGIQKRKNIN